MTTDQTKRLNELEKEKRALQKKLTRLLRKNAAQDEQLRKKEEAAKKK